MPRSRVFYGWWIVGVGLLSLLLGGGIGFYTFGVFFTELEEVFGWTRTELSLAITICCLMGLLGPIAGILVDRYGARLVMAIGALVTGAAFALLGLTNSLWYFYLMFLMMSVGMMGVLDIPIATMISNWFTRRRGLALGLALTGYGLGGLFMAPLASYLIDAVGWRWTFHTLGLVILIVLVPLCLLVVRHRPEDLGLLPEGEQPQEEDSPTEGDAPKETGWTLSGALRTPTFWLLVLVMIFAWIGLGSIAVHTVPLLEGGGFSRQEASLIFGFLLGMSVAGRVVGGYMADRMPIRYLTIAFLLLQAVGLALMTVEGSTATVWAFALILGLSLGGLATLTPLLVVHCFGLTSLGAILGGLWAFITIGFAGGPLLAGYIFDTVGNYNPVIFGFIGAAVLAAALMLILPRPRPTA